MQRFSYSSMFLYVCSYLLSRWCLTTRLVTSTVAWPISGGSPGTVMSSTARSVTGPPHYSLRVYPLTPTQVSKGNRIPHSITPTQKVPKSRLYNEVNPILALVSKMRCSFLHAWGFTNFTYRETPNISRGLNKG